MLISSVQLLSHVRLLATPWTTACQASLPITIQERETANADYDKDRFQEIMSILKKELDLVWKIRETSHIFCPLRHKRQDWERQDLTSQKVEEDGFQAEREKHVQSPWGAEEAVRLVTARAL